MNFKENETPEKLRGGYYTPDDIAGFLCRWVLERDPKALLEPSCGDGAFLRALQALPHSRDLAVTGIELDAAEAAKAREVVRTSRGIRAKVVAGDFLTWALERVNSEPEFDGIVGNPPFVRYQYLTPEMQVRAETLIRRFGLRFTKHTNAWVPFVVGSVNRLKPGGRLAMVVPSELFHVLHAESAREFLLTECSRVLVIDPEEIWFEGTLQGVVLLLAEKGEPSAIKKKGKLAIVRTKGRSFMRAEPSHLFDHADFVDGSTFANKWTPAILSARERRVLAELSEHPLVRRFSDVASAVVGIITGANKFFLVPDDVVREYELGGYAHPMFGRSEHVPGVVYDATTHADNRDAGFPTNFIWFDGVPQEQLTAGARRYLQEGRRQELHKRFKCRIREPWYSVTSVFASPIGMLKRSHDCPRLVLNSIDAYTTDTAYRVTPRGVPAHQLVYNFVNSMTALCAELEGRYYGGGVLELVPSEISRLMVPLAPASNEMLRQLDSAFRVDAPAASILQSQDREIFGTIGVSRGVQDELHEAWKALRGRRQRTEGSASEPDATDVDELSGRAVLSRPR